MNTRTRQWLKAGKMLDKYDPELLVFVKSVILRDDIHMNEAITFRKSELPKMREKYGDNLRVIVGDGT